MKLFVDLDNLRLQTSATDRKQVSLLEAKRGDALPLEVRFIRGSAPVRLDATTNITFAIKQDGKYDADPLVLEASFSPSAVGTPDNDPHYTATPSLNTTELNALYLINDDVADDPRSIDLMAELTWQATGDSGPTSIRTFTVRMANDVFRGDEGTPLSLDTPIDWLDSQNELRGISPIRSGATHLYPTSLTISGDILDDNGNPIAFTPLLLDTFDSSGRPTYSTASGPNLTLTPVETSGGNEWALEYDEAPTNRLFEVVSDLYDPTGIVFPLISASQGGPITITRTDGINAPEVGDRGIITDTNETLVWNGTKWITNGLQIVPQTLTDQDKAQLALNWPEAVESLHRNGQFISFDRSDIFPDALEVDDSDFSWSDGTTPLKVNVNPPSGGVVADYLPYIEDGGIRCADESVVYFGGRVDRNDGIFSLAVDFTLKTGDPTSTSKTFMNVSFCNRLMQDGSGIYPTGVGHFNISRIGVESANIFPQAQSNYVNRDRISDVTAWDENRAIFLEDDKRYTLVLRAYDDVVELSIVGIGTVIMQDDGFDDLHGPDMHFWVEPFSSVSQSTGSGLQQYAVIHQIAAMDLSREAIAPKLNEPTRIRTAFVKDTVVSREDGIPIDIGASGKTLFPLSGTKFYFEGGHSRIEGRYISDVGVPNLGGYVPAVAAMVVGDGIDTRLSSSAGAETTLYQARTQNNLHPGESETHVFRGELVSGAKKIVLFMTTYNLTLFDSNASGTPLDSLTGPFVLEVFRKHHDGMAFRFQFRLSLPDGSFILRSYETNAGNGLGINRLELRTTTANAGGIVLDSCERTLTQTEIK